MAFQLFLKRSATPGEVPTTEQLQLGELAINTNDGLLYLKTDVGGTETIVAIGRSASSFAHPVTLSLAGQASGSTSFDGSVSAVTLPVTLASTGVTAGTYTQVQVDSSGRVLAGSNPSVTGVTLSGDATGTGTGTISVTLATTGVTLGTYSLVVVDSKGRVTAGSLPAMVFSGDVTGSGNYAGSQLVLAPSGVSPGTYAKVTVNTKGLVTGSSSLSLADITTALGYLPASLVSPAFTGSPTAATPSTADNSTRLATTAYVRGLGYAPLVSPSFAGTVLAPTPTPATDSSNQIATTAFVWGTVKGAITSAYAVDSGVVANQITVSLSNVTALTAGLIVNVRIGHTNTAATTMTVAPFGSFSTARLDGLSLGPGMLTAGQVSQFIYDGSKFDLLSARSGNYAFNLASPPASDLAINPGDKVTVNFSNVTLVSMCVATVAGLYKVTSVITGTNTNNSDLDWLPNNTSYSNAFSFSGIEVADMNVTSLGSTVSGVGLADVNYAPYIGTIPLVYSAYNTLSQFSFDQFYGPNGVEGLYDFGPSIQEYVASTFTGGKLVKASSAINGGPAIGVAVWNDTTTPWTSLGALYDNGGPGGVHATISGSVIVERLI